MKEEIKKEILEELRQELFGDMEVLIEVCRDDVIVSDYANVGDAAIDLRSAEDLVINPGETKLVQTGIKMVIPEGFEIQIRPRSGLSLKTGLRIANSPATIDSNYRGELGVIVWNTGKDDYIIKKGDRIAQMVLARCYQMKFTRVEEGAILKYTSSRGSNGFGSTGIN